MAETLGERVRRLRLEAGLSQRELATKGASYAYISRIEAGNRNPSMKALRKIAARLGVTAAYLETGYDLEGEIMEVSRWMYTQLTDEQMQSDPLMARRAKKLIKKIDGHEHDVSKAGLRSTIGSAADS